MKTTAYHLPGLLEFTPRLFTDERGTFYETFSDRIMRQSGLPEELAWVQDNQSSSQQGVLRGLHFQRPPYAQAKLVRVAQGRAIDVVVDLRRDSPTYGQHQRIELSAAVGNILYVPIGMAHGFVAQEDNTLFLYKCSDYYTPAAEGGIRWDDPDLGIDWGTQVAPLVSPKDVQLPYLRDLDNPF
jgi:dTDP-4-dehydrorhamnose 3,5-epimerase